MEFYLMREDFKYCWGNARHYTQEQGLQSLAVYSVRNSFAALQAVVSSGGPMVVSVTGTTALPTHRPAPILRVAVTGDGPVQDASVRLIGLADDDDGTYKADLLLEQEAIFVDGRAQPVWIEIPIPADCAPGEYHGQVALYKSEMFGAETQVGCLPFSVTVRSVTLPNPENYSFYLDLWQHTCNIARKSDVRYFSDAHFEVLERYVRSLAALGQKAITVVVSDAPWSGQGCIATQNYPSDLYEYSMVGVQKTAAGFEYDFSAMDRYIELCLQYGIQEEIEVFGLTGIWTFPEHGLGKPAADYPEAMRVRVLEDGKYRYMDKAAELEAYVRALEAHFAQKGWLERVRVAADEPADTEAYRATLTHLARIAPGFRIKAATNRVEFIEQFAQQVTDFVPTLPDFAQKTEYFDSIRDTLQGRVAYYVCCKPKLPNTFLSSPLAEARLTPILAAWLRLDGFLRWNYTVWPERPREQLHYRSGFWSSGDTNFVYPGYNGAPLLSLRYKLLLRGIQDFELLQMVHATCPDSQAIVEQYFSSLIRATHIREFYRYDKNGVCIGENFAGDLYSVCGADYEAASDRLAQAVERAVRQV